jgi:hypothetical protein
MSRISAMTDGMKKAIAIQHREFWCLVGVTSFRHVGVERDDLLETGVE